MSLAYTSPTVDTKPSSKISISNSSSILTVNSAKSNEVNSISSLKLSVDFISLRG